MLNACANANNNCCPFKEIPCEISLFGSGAGGCVAMCRVVVTLKRLIPCIKCCTHPEAHDITVFQILYLWQCRTISMTFIYLLIFLLTSFVPIWCSFWIFNVFCFFSTMRTRTHFTFLCHFVSTLLAVMRHVHYYCVFDTFLIVIVTACSYPHFPIPRAVGCGCAKTASVYCYCLFYSSSSEIAYTPGQYFCIECSTKPNRIGVQNDEKWNHSLSMKWVSLRRSNVRVCANMIR